MESVSVTVFVSLNLIVIYKSHEAFSLNGINISAFCFWEYFVNGITELL